MQPARVKSSTKRRSCERKTRKCFQHETLSELNFECSQLVRNQGDTYCLFISRSSKYRLVRDEFKKNHNYDFSLFPVSAIFLLLCYDKLYMTLLLLYLLMLKNIYLLGMKIHETVR